MSSWICCNSCFLSPSSDRGLAVTTCGHVICNVCYKTGRRRVMLLTVQTMICGGRFCFEFRVTYSLNQYNVCYLRKATSYQTGTSVGLQVILHRGDVAGVLKVGDSNSFILNPLQNTEKKPLLHMFPSTFVTIFIVIYTFLKANKTTV